MQAWRRDWERAVMESHTAQRSPTHSSWGARSFSLLALRGKYPELGLVVQLHPDTGEACLPLANWGCPRGPCIGLSTQNLAPDVQPERAAPPLPYLLRAPWAAAALPGVCIGSHTPGVSHSQVSHPRIRHPPPPLPDVFVSR